MGCNACARGKDTTIRHMAREGGLPKRMGSDFRCDVAYVFELRYLLAVEDVTGFILVKPLESVKEKDLEEAMISVANDFTVWGHPANGARIFHFDADSSGKAIAAKVKQVHPRGYHGSEPA